MSTLLILSAGGIMLFTLYGAQREMQKSADQAALAGAAALPLLRPGVALGSLPMNTVYELTDDVGLDVPLKSAINGIPDPRAVACAYGTRSLQTDSAHLVNEFGGAPNPAPSSYCASGPWNDPRVNPSLNPLSTPLSACVNGLTTSINGVISQLNNSLNTLLCLPLVCNLTDVTNQVNDTIARLKSVLTSVQNLEALSPALLTPKMTVRVHSGVEPPMLSLITGGNGVQMMVESVAERRLKNAVVLPNTPRLTEVSLNSALASAKPAVTNALSQANAQLNTLMGSAPGGLNLSSCQNLLDPNDKVVKDIMDIYNPPASGGPAPTGQTLLNGAMAAAQGAASRAGTNVDQLAGEAFLVINQGPGPTTLSSLLGPVFNLLGLSSTLGMLQIPAVDVAIVAAHHLEDGNLAKGDCDPTTPTPEGDFICDALAARGLFTATLVK